MHNCALPINQVISKIQAYKYAKNAYPGWVTISDIQNELGVLPREELKEAVKSGLITQISAMCGECYYIHDEPLKYFEVVELKLKRR